MTRTTGSRWSWGWAALAASWVGLSACSSARPKFPQREPVLVDPDQRPFKDQPEEYFSPFAWDGADQTLFRPISRFFAVDPAGESLNVNALDEVPDSSWFTNRLSRRVMTPEEVALGPCKPGTGEDPTIVDAPASPWTVVGAKPNGANPGFMIKDAEGKRYLVKFDGTVQGPRATAADVLVSKLYYAAGYTVPCNSIVFFDRNILRIAEDATGENSHGEEEPLTEHHLDAVFEKALRLPDGRYRGSVSLFLEGRPIGPFTYQGTRDDDPNDIIDHEDRRELRGMKVLAAWTNHFDSREQNTLAMWIEGDQGMGFVRHAMIDFGDCLGSIWEPPMLGRRIGHAYYLDVPYVAEDLVTLGLIERPWDELRFGPSGPVFAYYDVEHFAPEDWRPGYPNPAFGRMSERDAAWMARIIAELGDEHLRAIIAQARLNDEFLERELFRLLKGRQAKVLRRYLTRLSPLTQPTLRSMPVVGSAPVTASEQPSSAPQYPQEHLCVTDLAVESAVASATGRVYGSRLWKTNPVRDGGSLKVYRRGDSEVCVPLPTMTRTESTVGMPYIVIDVVAGQATSFGQPKAMGPLRVHLWGLGGSQYQVAGIERPEDFEAPNLR